MITERSGWGSGFLAGLAHLLQTFVRRMGLSDRTGRV